MRCGRLKTSDRQLVKNRVTAFQPGFDPLTLQQPQRIAAVFVMDGFPEAGVVLVNLAHTGLMQTRQVDDMRTVRLGFLRGIRVVQ